MSKWDVKRRGTDSSGRGIYASDYMWAWWLRCCDILGFTPTIVQGAWMTLAGGGAGQSAGYHDGGGCFDIRIRDLSAAQRDRCIHVFRSMGAAYYERYESQGFDLHAHLCLGSDADIDDGAMNQWREYLAGGDGLTGTAPDYHWRPNPIVTNPPPEDDMTPDDWTRIDKKFTDLGDRIVRAIENQKLDVGRKGDWSDDTVAAAILKKLNTIESSIAPQVGAAVGEAINTAVSGAVRGRG